MQPVTVQAGIKILGNAAPPDTIVLIMAAIIIQEDTEIPAGHVDPAITLIRISIDAVLIPISDVSI